MLIADLISICLTSRSVFQTMLKEKQINMKLREMESSRLYVIEPYTVEDMKEPF